VVRLVMGYVNSVASRYKTRDAHLRITLGVNARASSATVHALEYPHSPARHWAGRGNAPHV